MVDPDDTSVQVTQSAESTTLGARAELRAWYLGRLRPKLADAVAARIVGPGAVEELDLQVADLFAPPGQGPSAQAGVRPRDTALRSDANPV